MPRNKKIIVITGGAGFVGTNLIKLLLKKTKNKIISIDDYSSGKKSNHIKNKNVKYIRGSTSKISKILKTLVKLILFFISVNFLEFIKASYKWTNVLNLILSAPMQYLIFV